MNIGICCPYKMISMGESNTVVNAYTFTMYRHLQQYCSHPSICVYILSAEKKRKEERQKDGKKARKKEESLFLKKERKLAGWLYWGLMPL